MQKLHISLELHVPGPGVYFLTAIGAAYTLHRRIVVAGLR